MSVRNPYRAPKSFGKPLQRGGFPETSEHHKDPTEKGLCKTTIENRLCKATIEKDLCTASLERGLCEASIKELYNTPRGPHENPAEKEPCNYL